MKYLYLLTLLLLAGCKGNIDHPIKKIDQAAADSIASPAVQETKEEFLSLILKADNNVLTLDSVVYYSKISKDIPAEAKKDISEMGFSINNISEILRNDPLADSCKIFMQTFSRKNDGSMNSDEIVSIDDFSRLINSAKWNRYKSIPFQIKLSNQQIIEIKEIYIP